jgi:hypothetical protein
VLELLLGCAAETRCARVVAQPRLWAAPARLARATSPFARQVSSRRFPSFRVDRETGRDQTDPQSNGHHREFAGSDGQRAKGRHGVIGCLTLDSGFERKRCQVRYRFSYTRWVISPIRHTGPICVPAHPAFEPMSSLTPCTLKIDELPTIK